ncbi:hypothetical protein ACQP2C_12710 [Micromonospora zamorensis]|uniref:hypothetical protein n=1 Tax=Micromonospora zamorensis TaxID=709883 RepID=UPI003D9719AD
MTPRMPLHERAPATPPGGVAPGRPGRALTIRDRVVAGQRPAASPAAIPQCG